MFGQVIGALSAATSAAQVAQGLTASMAVLGTLGGIVQSKHAQEALEDYAESKRAIRLEEDKRRRLELMRQKRIQQARIQNRAPQTGTSGSSGEIGAVQSVGTQTSANIAFLNQTRNMANTASDYMRTSRKYQSRANTATALGNIGMQLGDFAALDRLAGL